MELLIAGLIALPIIRWAWQTFEINYQGLWDLGRVEIYGSEAEWYDWVFLLGPFEFAKLSKAAKHYLREEA